MLKKTKLLAHSFLLACLPTAVLGHAGEPLTEQIDVLETGWVSRTSFGVVASHFDGFVCEEAFLGGEAFEVMVLGPDEWVTASENGVWRTQDGCDFEEVMTLPTAPTDAAVERESGQLALLINGNVDPGVYVSINRGGTFTNRLDRPGYQWTGVRFAQANRLVLSAYDRENAGAAHLVALDLETGVATDLNVPDVTYPYLLDAAFGQVLWLARAQMQSVFFGPLEQPDGVVHPISSWPTDARILGAEKVAFSGLQLSRGVSVGTLDQGAFTFEELVPTTTALCLAPDADDYLICAQRRFDNADIVRVREGVAIDEVNFTNLMGARACPTGTKAGDICPVVWRELARSLGLVPEGDDAGTNAGGDAGADANTPEPESDGGVAPSNGGSGDDGCSTGWGAPVWWAFLALLGWTRKR